MVMTIFGLITYLLLLVPYSGTEIPWGTDTLKITASGAENQVVVNTQPVLPGAATTDSLHLAGEVVQVGKNNRVKIQTPTSSTVKNKQHIHITQTGKNNSVKINSQ
jgi:Na+/melibiose symporter-like transporter